MWNLLDLLSSLLIAKDASDMAEKVNSDPPKERKWRWVAAILIFMLAIVSVGGVLMEMGLLF